MSPFHRPGWALTNGHIVRGNMEAALCEYLTRAVEPHTHASLNFDVAIAPGRWMLYTPSIALTETRRDGRIILIEAVDSAQPGGGVRRLRGFRREHGSGYFLVVVARRALHHALPPDAYDLVFPLEDFKPLDDFLRGLG